MELGILIAGLVGALIGGAIGIRGARRVRAAVETVKEMRRTFPGLDAMYVLPGERDATAVAKLDASPLSLALAASWRVVGDRVCYRDGLSTGMAVRIFLDGTGTIVAALIHATNLPFVRCYMYSFSPDTEYWTLPHQYRGLALGPQSRMAAANEAAGFDALVRRHRELVGEADDLLTMASADEVVAQWKGFFQRSVQWRDSQEDSALFETDALSLAGGNQRIAKRIARRIKQELPSARARPS